MDSIFEQFLTPAKNSSGQENAITVAVPLPAPRCEVNVRLAVPGTEDLAFVDALQKMHTHMVGFMPKKQIEAYIAGENMVIAEDEHKQPIGYCMAKDQYLKRDDVGIIYQLNVLPMKQRHLVGAALVKAVFDRAAYGCKLFCCWCAQDIQANYFWESIGFVPIAFRTGSRTKQRIHIFWQKRIREGDEGPGATEYWYPHQTSAGAVAEDRLVLPIPPGTHWRDAKPLVLPGITPEPEEMEVPKTLPGGAPVRPRPEETIAPKKPASPRLTVVRSQSAHPPGKVAIISAGGVKYVDHPDYVPPEEVEKAKPKRPRKPRQKHDPKQVKMCRELRDRYLDALQAGRILPPSTDAKYEVARQLEAGPCDSTIRRSTVSDDRLLDAA